MLLRADTVGYLMTLFLMTAALKTRLCVELQ